MLMTPTFTSNNTSAAYQLRYHFGWYSHGRQSRFESSPAKAVIADCLPDIARSRNYHILELDVRPSVVRSLLSLQPNQSPSQVTRNIKGNLAKQLREQADVRNAWARGLFVRSVGSVTGDVIRRYVAEQFAHHRGAPTANPVRAELARFHDPRDSTELRRDAHSVFEYNVHVVLLTQRRAEFLDFEVAKALIDYWRRVCDKNRWIAWDIEVVWNHAHLFLGLRPKDNAEQVVLSLMNNSDFFCQGRYGAAMRQANLTALWQPSFYVGAAGAATTAQVKSYLGRTRETKVINQGDVIRPV